MSQVFDKKGRLKIPAREVKQEELIVSVALCPEEHNLITEKHKIKGHPGIELAFRRANGAEGVVVLSPILGDRETIFLRGEVKEGEAVKFLCPVCDKELPILSTCDYCGEGNIYVLFMDDCLSFNNAITFCSKRGCPNSSIRKSDRIITALGL